MRTVTAAVIIESGRLFLAQRSQSMHLGGYWELPGGKVEPGEAPARALARELKEELAMECVVGELVASTVYRYEHGAFELLALETRRLSGFRLLEHSSFVWASPEQLKELQLAPADVELLDALPARLFADLA